MSEAENIYNIADNHARTVQVCIDRLHKLSANEELKVCGSLRQREADLVPCLNSMRPTFVRYQRLISGL